MKGRTRSRVPDFTTEASNSWQNTQQRTRCTSCLVDFQSTSAWLHIIIEFHIHLLIWIHGCHQVYGKCVHSSESSSLASIFLSKIVKRQTLFICLILFTWFLSSLPPILSIFVFHLKTSRSASQPEPACLPDSLINYFFPSFFTCLDHRLPA